MVQGWLRVCSWLDEWWFEAGAVLAGVAQGELRVSSGLAEGGFMGGIGFPKVSYRLGSGWVQEWHSAVPGLSQGWMSGGLRLVQG